MSGSQFCSTSTPPALDPASGSGHVENLAGLNTYVSGSVQSKLAVLLASDVFAKVVVELSKVALIQTAVMLHPLYVTVDDIKGVKVPIAIFGAELDHLSPPELIKQFDEILKASEVDSFVKIFPNCAHGWAVRYDINDPTAVAYADEAHKDMLEWFAKYLK